jgi:arylsulfatase A-like enzyme
MADKAPNIILILADSLRADALGCYGNPHGVTPHIDELADRGLRYETCYSTSPLCVPARSQLLSGRLCHETGNMQNQAWRFHTDRPTEVDGVCLDPGVTTLPERLHDLGYNSAHLGKNHFYPRDCSYGFQEMEQCDFYGRDVYEKDDYYLHLKEKGSAHLHRDAFGRMDVVGTGGAGAIRDSFGLVDRLCPYVSELPAELQTTPWLGERTRTFLRRQSAEKPFFLVTSFYAPHDPYCVSSPNDKRFDWQSMELPALPEQLQPSAQHVGEQSLRTILPDETWRKNIAHYLANVSLIDREVGAIVEQLKEQGVYENTIILLTSDHGDTLGEHRIWGKNLMYECCARIPLIVHHGGGKTARGVTHETATLLDIFPTLLRQAGVEPEDDRIAGRTLDLDSTAASPDDRVVVGELANSQYPQYFIRQGSWKLIYLDGYPAWELYNLSEDPGELNDLSASEPGIRDNLHQILQDWVTREAPHVRPAHPGTDQIDMQELCRLSHL